MAVESEAEEDSTPVLELPVMSRSQPGPIAFRIDDLMEPAAGKRRKRATLWPSAKDTNVQLSLFD